MQLNGVRALISHDTGHFPAQIRPKPEINLGNIRLVVRARLGSEDRRMKIGVPKETARDERRVALTPDGVKERIAKGDSVIVQSGAGDSAYLSDAAFEAVGATIAADFKAMANEADLIVKVLPPTLDEVAQMREGTSLVSFLYPYANPDLVNKLVAQKVSSYSMELMPRISRAQSMDALSSMSTIAGYKAVLIAADHLPNFFPMLMTAAGTLPAAKAFVLGAGVAGLQAIATCRRLGAKVEAFDVRPAVKEQIESLGAKFVGLNLVTGEGEGEGGYAKELSKDTHQQELDLIAGRLPQMDAVITTALIPNRPAPILITREMLKLMKPGAVIVDLAASAGGNCEGTVPGETVVVENVTIVGRTDLVTSMPTDASKMYAKNITSLLAILVAEGKMTVDMTDEIVVGTLVTHEGAIIHEGVKKALGGNA